MLFGLLFQIEDTAAVEGVQLRNVEIHIDKSTKLPRGSASAELVKHHGVDDGEVLDVEGAVAVLTGADFGGRPLRVERSTNKTQSRKSSAGGPRYFGGSNGINTKCFLCGEVGHIQSECTSDPVVRCHLCARADHDPGMYLLVVLL